MADGAGRPVAVQACPGNTGDPATVPDQVDRFRRQFGLKRVVLVGDALKALYRLFEVPGYDNPYLE